MTPALLVALALAQEPPPPVQLHASGYLDFGAFAVSGDGVSYRRDPGGEITGIEDETWVYWGDPWASTVNSRGEVADLGADRNNLGRFDAIHSGGRPTFLVHTANVALAASRGPGVTGILSVDLMPRSGSLGSPGDAIAVDLAYLDLLPVRTANWRVYLGKFSTVFGQEYTQRTAPVRFGITPSLMSRYTTGTPLGVKLRGSVLDRRVWFAASLTNGGATTERFGHFADELDSNGGKTGTIRVAGRVKGLAEAQVGASLQAGAVDGQPSSARVGWQSGFDGKLRIDDFELLAEFVWVRLPGQGLPDGDFVMARGGYFSASLLARPWVGALLRLDWRDAQMRVESNYYDSNVARITGGLRFVPRPDLTVKIEYIGVVELIGPGIPDDVLTASTVFTF